MSMVISHAKTRRVSAMRPVALRNLETIAGQNSRKLQSMTYFIAPSRCMRGAYVS